MSENDVFYDKEGDVLDVSIGEPKKALSREKHSFSKPFNIPVKAEMKMEA